MAEYIDRAEYCEKHCRCSNEYCDKENCPIWKAPAADVAPVVHGRWIEKSAPAYLALTEEVDSVPVVRCKDCRYFKMYKCRMGYSNHDDFCSYGTRKEKM